MPAKPIAITLAALLTLAAHAAESSDAVRQAIEPRLGGKVDELRPSPLPGIYEVRLGDRLVYIDGKADYIFNGNLFDARSRVNLTQERLNRMLTIRFAELPLQHAVKTVRGDGSRLLATFEDPNCIHCRKLAGALAGLDNVTIYTFLLPILSPDSEDKARAVWCAGDRAGAWGALMHKGLQPAPGHCEAPIEAVRAFARQHRIEGTPTLFLASGERLVGAVPREQIEKKLAARP